MGVIGVRIAALGLALACFYSDMELEGSAFPKSEILYD
jgi:hypothetical protein